MGIIPDKPKETARFQIINGNYMHKEKGVVTNEVSTLYDKSRYKFLLEAPFNLSAKCCNITKKKPLHKYQKDNDMKPMTAQMASESKLRTQKWLKNGCNGFNMKSPISNPMSFWTEQDVLEYIKLNNLPICKVYGEVVQESEIAGQISLFDIDPHAGIFDDGAPALMTTGCDRTGCVGCGFGVHLEKSPNRWEISNQISNPKMIDFLMRGGDFAEDGLWKPDNRGMGFWFVIEWLNIHGNLKIVCPNREKYIKEFSTDLTNEYLYGDRKWSPQI